MAGRPSSITEALIANFCSKLRVSGSIETAIKACGVGRETYYGWARKVREGGGSRLERQFIGEVSRTEGEVKMLRESMLSKHFGKQWQALAWWLERRYPSEYCQRRGEMVPAEAATTAPREVEHIFWRENPPVPEPVPDNPASVEEGDRDGQSQPRPEDG
jgi:hypothetical protein